MAVVVINWHVVLDESERVVLLDLLDGTTGSIVIEIESLAVERPDTHEFMVDIIHVALGIWDRASGDEEAPVVCIGNDLEVGGIDHLDRIAEVGHEIGHIETPLLDFRRDASHDGLAGQQGFVAIDHHIQIGIDLGRNLIQSFGRSVMIAGGHHDLSTERLATLLDFLAVRGHIDSAEFSHFLAMLINPLHHGLAQNFGHRLVEESGRLATGRNYADYFHFLIYYSLCVCLLMTCLV